MTLKDALDIHGKVLKEESLKGFQKLWLCPDVRPAYYRRFRSQRDQMIIELFSWGVDQVSDTALNFHEPV